MQRVGQTDKGMILFEMTQDEAFVFNRLALAIEGKTVSDIIMRDDTRGYLVDYSGVFGAIMAFSAMKFRVNEIRAIADELERTLFREEP